MSELNGSKAQGSNGSSSHAGGVAAAEVDVAVLCVPSNGLRTWNGVEVPEGLLCMVVPASAVENREKRLSVDQVARGALAFARQVQGVGEGSGGASGGGAGEGR